MMVNCRMDSGPVLMFRGMLDTGAFCDVMGYAAWKAIRGNIDLLQSPIKLLMADGTTLKARGMTPVIHMEIAGHSLLVKFVVVDWLEKENFLLGRAFLRKFDVMMNSHDLNRNFNQFRNPDQRYRICKKVVLIDFRGRFSAILINTVKQAPLQMKAFWARPKAGHR